MFRVFLGGVPGFLWVFLVFLGMLLVSLGCSGFLGGVPGFLGVPGCAGVPVFRCSGVPVFLEVLHALTRGLRHDLGPFTRLRHFHLQN